MASDIGNIRIEFWIDVDTEVILEYISSEDLLRKKQCSFLRN